MGPMPLYLGDLPPPAYSQPTQELSFKRISVLSFSLTYLSIAFTTSIFYSFPFFLFFSLPFFFFSRFIHLFPL